MTDKTKMIHLDAKLLEDMKKNCKFYQLLSTREIMQLEREDKRPSYRHLVETALLKYIEARNADGPH